MARLPIQNVETATGTNKDIFAAFQKALGTVPNMTRVMANSPAVLQAYAQFNGALSTGKLPAKVREQIALLTAQNNDCTYCLSAHSLLGKMVGLSPSQIDAARRAQSTDPLALAALTFAQAVIDQRGGVDEAQVSAARDAGLTDAQLAEIVAGVALNYLTNFFNRAFDVDVDFPRVEAHDLAAAQ